MTHAAYGNRGATMAQNSPDRTQAVTADMIRRFSPLSAVQNMFVRHSGLEKPKEIGCFHGL